MNHIYRSIRNEITGAVVTVSELAGHRGKKASAGRNAVVRSGFVLQSGAFAVALLLASNSHASPAGGTVVAGDASITSTPGNTTINQTSRNAALNWQSFNIAADESVRFVQPDSSSVALNRVLGADPSSILGNLSANGKVFLVNPNGILFGRGARVDVGGLVASTRNITNSDFLAGRYKFSGAGDGAVVNEGEINATGGYVALLGATASNQGVIAARLGTVALAAGEAFTLDVAGDGLLNVAVDAGAVNALVRNGGLIRADGGQVLLTAQSASDLLPSAVNNTGTIQAQTIENRNGTIRLLGDMQSGTANVGGTLDASAPNGGDGGFIDTSAAYVNVASDTKVTTAAALGLTGSWLIDPPIYTIATSGGNTTGAALSSNLASTDIIIASGGINVNDTVSWSIHTLTLRSQGNVAVNSAMNASGTASLAVEYGLGAIAASNPSTFEVNAPVDLPAGNHFSMKLGSNGSVIGYTVITSVGAAGSNTGADLQGMGAAMAGHYALGRDIDASATSGWNAGAGFAPIGDASHLFQGFFNGLGHTITGLTIHRPAASSPVGLFSNTGASADLRNVGLVGVGVISGSSYTGALVGRSQGTVDKSYSTGSVSGTDQVGGLIGGNYGTVSRSYATAAVNGRYDIGGLVGIHKRNGLVNDSYASGVVTGESNVGGLLGNSYYGVTDNSFATGAVSGVDSIGGLIGYADYGLTTASHASGAVTGTGPFAGGLIGQLASYGVVENAYSTGNVIATTGGAGGLIGDLAGTVRNSYASGAVSGAAQAGGMIGRLNGGGISDAYATGAVTGAGNVGGLIGRGGNGVVDRAYASGAVTGTGQVGGFVGFGAGATITNGYWDTTSSGQATSAGGTGLTTVQMQTASNFSGLHFTGVPGSTGNNWVLVTTDGTLNNAAGAAGATRPMLASEYSTTIINAHQLQLMSMALGASYTLSHDIDASATGTTGDVWHGASFIPVGAYGAAFTGSLDGQGHTISDLNINRPGRDYVGLFGYGDAASTIKNVGLLGGSAIGESYVGMLAGQSDGAIMNDYTSGTVQGRAYVGGLVGAMEPTGSITGSSATGEVTGTEDYVGGLIGHALGAVSSSFATGAVTTPGNYVGGLVGYGSSISDSYASGDVSGGNNTGGLVGLNVAEVTNSYATGAIQGNQNVGGLLGSSAGGVSNTYATGSVQSSDLGGGLIGMQNGPVSNSYATGAVSGTGDVGGLSAGSNGPTTDSYWDTVTSGLASSVGGMGLTTTEMRQMASFSSWNTATPNTIASTGSSGATWRIYEGHTAPLLTSFLTPLTLGDVPVTYNGTAQDGANGAPVDVFGTTATNAGVYNFYSSQQGYDLTGGTLSIAKASLTLSGTRAYDGSTGFAGNWLTATGVAGETFALTGAGNTSNLASRNVQSASTLASVAGLALGTSDNGGLIGNYNALSTSGSSVNVTRAALTLSSGNVVKSYDGGLDAAGVATPTSGTLFSTDSTSGGTFAFTDKNVGAGNKVVTTTGVTVNDGNGGGNYNVTYASNTASTINPYAVDLTGSRVYDGGLSVAAGTLTTGPLVGSETLGLTGTGVLANRNVGNSKAVALSTLTLVDGTHGGIASNYTFVGGSQTLNVTAASVTLGSANVRKSYDGGLTAAGSVTLSSGTLFGGDTISGGEFAFTDKNAGSGNKTVTAAGVAINDGNSGGNYNVSYANNTTSTIDPATLTVSVAAPSKVYDGKTSANATLTVLTGLAGNETVNTAGAATFNSKDVATANLVTVNSTTLTDGANGGRASNYVLASGQTVAAHITPKALQVAGQSAQNKIYDGTTTATLIGGSLQGLVDGETVALTEAGTFATAAAGSAIVITAADSLSGTAAANYALTQPTGLLADITAATVPPTPEVPQPDPVTSIAYQSAVSHVYSDAPTAPASSSSAPALSPPANNSISSGSVTYDVVGLNLSIVAPDTTALPAPESQDRRDEKK